MKILIQNTAMIQSASKLRSGQLALLLGIFAILSLFGCNSGGGGKYLQCGGPKEFICPSGMFCELVEKCGGMDRWGICKPMPTECANEDFTVCGCDNKNYASPCYASASGITIAYDGTCHKK